MVAQPDDVSEKAAEQAAPASEAEQDTGRTEVAAAAVGTAVAPSEAAAPEVAPAAEPGKSAESAAKPAVAPEAAPIPADPETCQGIAISQQAFEEAAMRGEFDGTDYLFYLEPAGVLEASLVCARRYPHENLRAGILMTKTARDAKTVFLDDGINPSKYELSFPKEFGYVKSIQHYLPESREHANYPWSKRY